MTHYSHAQSPTIMTKWACSVAKSIREEEIKSGFRPVLVYSGMSGIASATAIAMAVANLYRVDIGMIYVRKTGERSHGDPIETNLDMCADSRILLPIFVDDFISTGATLCHCFQEIEENRSVLNFKVLRWSDDQLVALSGDPWDPTSQCCTLKCVKLSKYNIHLD